MAIRYFSSSIIASANGADAVTANDGDTIIVEAGVTLGATGANVASPSSNLVFGIYGAAGVGSVDISVYGVVFGTYAGIELNDPTTFQALVVGANGRVQGESYGARLTGSNVLVENAGSIRADFQGLFLDSDRNTVLNTGTITSTAFFAINVTGGDADLVNTGTITSTASPSFSYSYINEGTGADRIWNSGLMFGSVGLGDGNDLYQGGGLVLNGNVEGGLGNDTLIGGAGDDNLSDSGGANWIAGGDGADRIRVVASSGINNVSHLFGGISGGADTSAMDTISCDNGANGHNIFLSTGGAIGSVARASDNSTIAWITGFENALGSTAADAIFGSSADNVIEGANGGDWMVGNGGADRFVFNFAAHADAGDQIRDFRRSEADRIDLSGIDADTISTFESAFVFRTAHTNNAAGEVVITNFGNSARVDLYTNADNIVDGTFVVVYGEAGVTNLQATDFFL